MLEEERRDCWKKNGEIVGRWIKNERGCVFAEVVEVKRRQGNVNVMHFHVYVLVRESCAEIKSPCPRTFKAG